MKSGAFGAPLNRYAPRLAHKKSRSSRFYSTGPLANKRCRNRKVLQVRKKRGLYYKTFLGCSFHKVVS
jgi:hypothetical protein